jgi:hypothetical protein
MMAEEELVLHRAVYDLLMQIVTNQRVTRVSMPALRKVDYTEGDEVVVRIRKFGGNYDTHVVVVVEKGEK